MNALWAITMREMRERWTLPLAAFCLGFVPVAILRYGPSLVDPSDISVMAVAAVPAAWVVALLMGASVIARDLADGRLAFFFARPVPWWSIAGGKLLAAVALTLATAVAGVLPALIVAWRPAFAGVWDFLTSAGLVMNLALVLALIGLGHAASVVYRSRSPWAALDFVLFALAIAGVAAVLRALARWGMWWGGSQPGVRIVLAGMLLLAALTLAPALAQLARGRSDLRRGHRVLSLTLWGGLLLLLTPVGGYLAWEASLGPEAFPRKYVTAVSSDGRFVGLSASRGSLGPGDDAGFLLDTSSASALRLSAMRSWPSFSADGRHAVWLVEPLWNSEGAYEVEHALLSGATPQLETLELEPRLPRERLRGLALDAKAERLAVVQVHTLSLHELPSGRSLSRSAAADGEWEAAAFLPDGRLRAFRRVRAVAGGPNRPTLPGFLEIVELGGGLPSRAVALDAVGHAVLWSPAEGERVLLLEPQSPRSYSLHEVSSGRRLRTFTGEDSLMVNDAKLLPDGRVALIESDHERSRLRLADGEQPDRVVELPRGLASIGGASAGGLLSVSVRAASDWAAGATGGDHWDTQHWETLFVAIGTGELVRREPRLRPAAPFGRPSGPTAPLFVAGDGELVRLDAATGERQVLLSTRR